MPEHRPEYRLSAPAPPAAAPVLDEFQQAVLDHRGGPLMVLAGPGTGKTTTMVELVAQRVAEGLPADDVLVLTFSRKAAEEVRGRIARRLGGGAVVATMTFHSYCYALVRSASSPEDFADPLRLLSAPEQGSRLAEILSGAIADGRLTWPDALAPALGTRGLVSEVADFLASARSYGLDVEMLRALAVERDEPVWRAISELWDEYSGVEALQNETDYAALVDRAVGVLESDPDRHRPRLLVVDEYQDTDRAQIDLVKQLAGPTTDLVVVGDPDQSIYGFRGADPRAMGEFDQQFGLPHRPTTTLSLRRSRRSGAPLLAVSRDVVRGLGVVGATTAESFAAFRDLVPDHDTGTVETPVFVDARAEAEHVALLLARAHLDDGLPYDRMAVLVRGEAALAPFERALRESGIPVEVAGDEIPLARQPAVRSLLHAARCAVAGAAGTPLTPEDAETLLLGPIGRLDPSELRSLARVLRRDHHDRLGEIVDSGRLLALALTDTVWLFDLETRGQLPLVVERVRRIAVTLQHAMRLVLENQAAEQVLWTLWDGTRWPAQLMAAAERGDVEAHRDLDAVVALFDDAARAQEQGGNARIQPFLEMIESQHIPADPLAERGIRGSAVRLMTAHRSKGLEWDLVVVGGVQDGVWPAVRPQHSLLRAERVDPLGDGRPPSFGELLAEERRLFYVAVTRAKQRLVVTAVQSPASDGDQPSRFHEQVRAFATDAADPAPLPRPRRGATLRGVVTELRLLAEHGSGPAVRAAAAERLARLADDGVGAASPDRWWGLADESRSDVPVRPVDAPLDLSGTAVEGLTGCALRWFLSREAKGERGTSTAQGFGLAIHVLAAELLDDPSVDPDTLATHLDAIWGRLDHDTPWIADAERAQADLAVTRLVRWHRADAREPLGAEVEFVVEIPLGDDTVRVRGSMDRVEIDDEGRVHVVDFKTGNGKPTAADLEVHPQLGVYQVAVMHGAVEGHDQPGGAELVHLRQELARNPGMPVVQAQKSPEPDQPFFATELLTRSAATLRSEQFVATVNPRCEICPFNHACPAQHGGPTVGQDDT